jgi:hypothetical protein
MDVHRTDAPQSKLIPVSEFAEQLRGMLSGSDRLGEHPEHLAALFRYTFQNSSHALALRYCLQTALLKATVERARAGCAFYASPVYREWAETPAGEAPDLSCWPVIDRQMIIDQFDDFLSSEVSYSFTCHTSGSTGPALSIYKSVEETRFIRRYFEHLFEPNMRGLPSLPLILSFPNFYHGVGIPMPTLGKVFVSGVTDNTLIQDAAKVLRAEYKIRRHDRRISIISGLLFHVQFFTSYMLEQEGDLRSFGIRSVNLSGGYVARSVRKFIADAWGATVFDRYSLTEVLGGGYRCFRCGHFHLDPHVIGEVVDVDTGKVIDEGIGRLVLTSLYPFVQMQPILRYDPGDLVRRVRSTCGPELSFDFLGKEKNCVRLRRDGVTEWLLFSVDVFECLGEIPDINVFEWFSNVGVARDRTVGARQLYAYTLKTDGLLPVIELDIELRYAPHCFTDRVAELKARILDALRCANPLLGKRIDAGELGFEIRFIGPGALGNRFVIKT